MTNHVSSVHSIDYDGCISDFLGGEKNPLELMDANLIFLNHIKAVIHAEGLSQEMRTITIGSARQSKPVDLYCAQYNKGSSCFPLYLEIAKELQAQFDSFLLADLKADDCQDGDSYKRAMALDYDGPHEDWFFDESKITLIYAQMHRASLNNINGKVIFHFYDDRSDILNALNRFYQENSSLIPSNLTLKLHRHSNYEDVAMVYHYDDITNHYAQNNTDICYKQTAQSMGNHIQSSAYTNMPLNISEVLNLRLENFSPISQRRLDTISENPPITIVRPRAIRALLPSIFHAIPAATSSTNEQDKENDCPVFK